MDLDKIRDHYSHLPDFKIVEIANYDVADLPPEVVEIVKKEIRIRNLPSTLLDSIAIKTKVLTDDELQGYIELIQNLPDPATGETGKPLNAVYSSKCICYIFFSKKSISLVIGNASTIQKRLEHDTILTSIFGWWGLGPIFYSISALRRNNKMSKLDLNTPTPFFIDFVRSNVGFIEANKKNVLALNSFLRRENDYKESASFSPSNAKFK